MGEPTEEPTADQAEADQEGQKAADQEGQKAADQEAAVHDPGEGSTMVPQQPTPHHRRRRSKILAIGIPTTSVLVVLVLIAAFCGLQQRRDRITTVQPGMKMATGPFTFTLTKATVQWSKRYESTGGEVVRASGSIKNTGTEARRPRTNQFAARDVNGRKSVQASLVEVHETSSSNRPSTITPGLPPVAVSVVFSFPGKVKLDGAKIRIAARKLSYGQHHFLQSSKDKTWSNSDKGFNVELPLKRLPAQKTY